MDHHSLLQLRFGSATELGKQSFAGALSFFSGLDHLAAAISSSAALLTFGELFFDLSLLLNIDLVEVGCCIVGSTWSVSLSSKLREVGVAEFYLLHSGGSHLDIAHVGVVVLVAS